MKFRWMCKLEGGGARAHVPTAWRRHWARPSLPEKYSDSAKNANLT